jgi:hypothetical protein
MQKFLIICLLAILFLNPDGLCSTTIPQKKIIISGHVRDLSSGEMLAGVTVYDANLKQGTTTNSYGYYSLTINQGNYNVQYSYIGYKSSSSTGTADNSLTIDINLETLETMLGEVVISDRRTNENVRAPEMSIVKLDVKSIKSVAALFGEVDLVKVLQLLPGVQSTSEGSTGYSVRGGSSDQNLIILDEAAIHNASHLMGFFSIFNNDAIKEVTLYKGDIPAAYGGRLSSLLDVRMKDGNSKRIGFSGSIGSVSSKLTIEGPIIKDRTTFLISGRRTYADLFLLLSKDEAVRQNKLYFYDFNLKLSHIFNDNNRLYLSGYSGRDVFKNDFALFGFGNQTASLRWNHLFSRKLFFNLSLIYSKYSYELGMPEAAENSFLWDSKMHDYSARFDFTHFLTNKHTLRYGATTMLHTFDPGRATGQGDNSFFTEFILPSEYALEHSLYASDEFKAGEKFTLKYGLRFALFQNIGPGTIYKFDENYLPVDSTVYDDYDIFNSYTSFEPRITFTYLVNEVSSVKGSYSHTGQFLTLAQNSTAGTPLDVWFPASPNVKPQVCDQYSVGYFRNFRKNMYEVSAELYYKNLNNVIDFKDHAQLLLNKYLEGEIRTGKGYSYGVETMVRKDAGRLTGWLSYTYSRSYRIIDEINNGKRYNAPYDKPHAVNVVVNYDIFKRLNASVTWIYATGLPVTFPTGRAVIGNSILPIYSDRNSYRMPDYHRMDLSVTLKGKVKPGKRWTNELNLSIYNVYNRHNAWSINFVADQDDPNVTYAEKTYLFSIIPAVTYSVKF